MSSRLREEQGAMMKQKATMKPRRWSRVGHRFAVLSVAALVLTSCGQWQGIANVPLPGGPGT